MKKYDGPYPKVTTIDFANHKLTFALEADGGITIRISGSHNVYSVRKLRDTTEIELELRP